MIVILFVLIFIQSLANFALFSQLYDLKSGIITAIEAKSIKKAAPVTDQGLQIGSKAPTITLKNEALEEKEVLSKRTINLVMFSSTSCRYCKNMYPRLIEVSEKYNGLQVSLLSYGPENEQETLLASLEKGNIAFFFLDEKTLNEFEVDSSPFFYVVDSESTILNKGHASDLESLESLFAEFI